MIFKQRQLKKKEKSMGGLTQRSWTPTKRRGPIAAEFVTPGPACVTLPPLIGNYNYKLESFDKVLFFLFDYYKTVFLK